jgi:hypothetical protein
MIASRIQPSRTICWPATVDDDPKPTDLTPLAQQAYDRFGELAADHAAMLAAAVDGDDAADDAVDDELETQLAALGYK